MDNRRDRKKTPAAGARTLPRAVRRVPARHRRRTAVPARGNPLVSVIVPAYNAEKYIARTLETILSQTYTRLEVIVVDDASTDRTVNIVREFARRDPRVRLLSQPHLGVSRARNLAIERSRGEFIAPVDADDLWHREKIRDQVDCMLREGASVGLVYSWSRTMDEHEVPISGIAHEKKGDVLAELMYSNFIGNGSAALIRRSCFDVVGGFDPQLSHCEDWDLYLRVAERYRVGVVPKYQVGYRRTLGGQSANYGFAERTFTPFMDGVRRRHPEVPAAIFRVSKSFYSFYLSGICNEHGQYLESLKYLLRCLVLDPARLLSSEYYLAFVKWWVRVLAKPLSAFGWGNQTSWRKLKRMVAGVSGNPLSSVPFDERRGKGWSTTRLYDRIHNRRITKFKQHLRMSAAV